jgi:hypothetical protein
MSLITLELREDLNKHVSAYMIRTKKSVESSEDDSWYAVIAEVVSRGCLFPVDIRDGRIEYARMPPDATSYGLKPEPEAGQCFEGGQFAEAAPAIAARLVKELTALGIKIDINQDGLCFDFSDSVIYEPLDSFVDAVGREGELYSDYILEIVVDRDRKQCA